MEPVDVSAFKKQCDAMALIAQRIGGIKGANAWHDWICHTATWL
jgi:hypothetical protein